MPIVNNKKEIYLIHIYEQWLLKQTFLISFKMKIVTLKMNANRRTNCQTLCVSYLLSVFFILLPRENTFAFHGAFHIC